MAEGDGKIVVVVGAGSKHDLDGKQEDLDPSIRWGLGGALGMPFVEAGFHVALLGRRKEVIEEVTKAVAGMAKGEAKVVPLSCDMTKDEEVEAVFSKIQSGELFGEGSYIDCVIYNAAAGFPPGFSFGDDCIQPHQIDTKNVSEQMDLAVNGLIRVSKAVIPGMLARGRGCFLLSGATMQLRGGAKFGAIAPAKTAQRSLGQSMYQSYAPRGIHVCNMNIDGVIDSPNTRKWMPIEKLMPPLDIASQFLAAYRQPKSVWSYEMMLTPAHSSASVGMRM